MPIFSLFTSPIANILIAFYQLIVYLHIPFAMGIAIIALTAFIRLLMYPIITSQIRQAHKMQKLNPHMAAIRAKHKEDKKRQQEEIMKLYKEHGVNPATGCVTAIVQLFIFSSLYTVLIDFARVSTAGGIEKINKLLYFPALKLNPKTPLDTSFFGLSIADSPQKLFSHMPFIILIPILTGVLQLLLSRMMMPEKTLPKTHTEKEDFATAFQSQSLFIFPVMIGFFAFTLPIGMSLYWNTFTIFGILQQYLLVGWGGMKPWISKVYGTSRNS